MDERLIVAVERLIVTFIAKSSILDVWRGSSNTMVNGILGHEEHINIGLQLY